MKFTTTDHLVLAFLIVAAFALVVSLGREAGVAAEHAKAIQVGVGRWDVDFHTGERRFVYGVPKP